MTILRSEVDLGISGRVALVGGGSSGLGRAIADRLAAEGCRLAIWSRGIDALEQTAAELETRYGGKVTVIAADATHPSASDDVAAGVLDAFGSVDILVLNSGGPPPVDPTDTSVEGWSTALQLLVLTPIRLATLLLPGMRERRWGRITALLSSGVRQPIPELVYSNAGRGALMAWLKTTARAIAAEGVTANGVMPGRIETPRIDFLDRDRARRTGETVETVRAQQIATIPAARYGRPDELASLVAYLCSEPAGYQTGTFTAVDGGLISGLP
jgi:3-oxoacyl-[acyl-carrier protein] reductase